MSGCMHHVQVLFHQELLLGLPSLGRSSLTERLPGCSGWEINPWPAACRCFRVWKVLWRCLAGGNPVARSIEPCCKRGGLVGMHYSVERHVNCCCKPMLPELTFSRHGRTWTKQGKESFSTKLLFAKSLKVIEDIWRPICGPPVPFVFQVCFKLAMWSRFG